MNFLKITQKPIRTLMKIDGVEVVENVKYPLDIDTNVSVENETVYKGEPFDNFKYKIYNEDVESINEGTVNISFETNKTELPAINTLTKELDLYSEFYFSEIVTPEQYYDRIVITNIVGRGSWIYNDSPLIIGQEMFFYELVNNLKFVSDVPGVMDNYSILTWDTKDILGPDEQENTIAVNTNSEGAELILVDFLEQANVDESGLETLIYSFIIRNSIVSSTYKIEVDTTPFLSIGVDPLDTVELTERDLSPILINTSGLSEITSSLDENGETIYSVIIKKNTDTTEENSIIINLIEVDEDSLNVNPLFNTITLLIPITPTP